MVVAKEECEVYEGLGLAVKLNGGWAWAG